MKRKNIIILSLVIVAVAGLLITKSFIKDSKTSSANYTSVGYDNDNFYEKYLEAKKKGTVTLIVFTHKPFCECEGRKEIGDGYTLESFNNSTMELLNSSKKKFDKKIETIILDTNSLGYEGLTKYFKLTEELNIKATPALAILDKNSKPVNILNGSFKHDEVMDVIENKIKQ